MATLFLTTAFIWGLMIGTTILCSYARPSEITKSLATTAAIILTLEAYTWAIIALAG